ncbi:MAG: 30S ribosomal protein S6 [Deltaproteobacteria bacterium]|nr:30S ribosomal protein S6 [Deltaproteobacteria bacterium]
MKHYETVYIINPNLADEAVADIVARFSALIEKSSGVVTKVDEWGKRDLAYDIKKFNKGYYVLMQFCGDPGITVELQRQFGLDDSILKSQTILLSDHADPEALKAEAQAAKAKETVEETETETTSEDEGKDGVQ